MDNGSLNQLPLPTLDQFAVEVATSATNEWLSPFVQHLAHLLNSADVAVVLRSGSALQLLAGTGQPPPLTASDGSEGEALWLPLPGVPDALVWVRASVEAQAAQAKLEGWLGVAGLGVARLLQVQEAERQRVARDHFFSMVNHDLKSPLSSIKAMADLVLRKLQRGTLDPATPKGRDDLLERLGFVSQRVKDLAELIDEIAEVSYIERGRLDLNQQKVSLVSVLGDCVQRIQDELDRTVQIEDLDEPLYVRGDARRLSQLFHHLLKNAVRYSEPETPIVVRFTADGEAFQVEVEDRGSGMDEEQQSHLFHEYGRVVQKGATGLGVGLFLAHALTVAHGGSIALQSVPDEGTTVRVTLPCLKDEPTPA